VYTVTRAIIAGGGIVGLTSGRALLQAGMEVLVAEKADAIRAAGATLGLWANAVSDHLHLAPRRYRDRGNGHLAGMLFAARLVLRIISSVH
jgi:2-polyprenyl-6-methoxyphenol hydroxylase-like FAD-dependent oxidoreductase